MKLVSLLVALVAVALLAAGCGSKGRNVAASSAPAATEPATSPPPLSPKRGPVGPCTVPSDALLAAIRRNVVLGGARLTNPSEVQSALRGVFVVSAHVTGGGAPDGMIATWAAAGRDGPRVYSLDANAALVSLYGAGVTADPHLVVSLPGVYRSRVCAGGPGASHGETAPPAGGHSSSAG